jgi:tRNA1(Val) A37 N6-methylase TrmN6
VGDVLAALALGFGALSVMPIHPKPNAAAIRVLVHAAKERGGPLKVVPGLVLADAKGKPTAQAEAVLRDGAALALTGD